MFRDLYSTKARVHNFRPAIRKYGSLTFPHIAHSRRLALLKVCNEARLTLGNFPAERQLLYHHPLNGLEELAFIDALEFLHRLTSARVWPSAHHISRLFQSGLISVDDWKQACEVFAAQNAVPLEKNAEALRELYMNSAAAPAPVSCPPMLGLASGLDQVLHTDLVKSINSELAQLLENYARACAGTETPVSLWIFAADAFRTSDEPHARSMPATAHLWADGPETILLKLLDQMAIPQSLWRELILQAAWSMSGWASWLNQYAQGGSYAFVSLMALRFSSELAKLRVLGRKHGFEARWNPVQTWIRTQHPDASAAPTAYPLPGMDSLCSLQAIGLEAREIGWRRRFLARIEEQAQPQLQKTVPQLQGIFCIDVRCERMRHALEEQGSIETFGMAGAFLLKPHHIPVAAYPTDEQLAERLLRQIDIKSRLILICGHSHPHGDAWCSGFLECTACGGRSGREHALYSAQLLNDPSMRAAMQERGLAIPDDTLFLGGVYRTDRQEIELLESEQLPPSHAAALAQLKATIAAAGQQLKPWALAENILGGAAGNAAFLIGPRALSRGLDLEGSCFLHSYEEADDVQAVMLAQIFQGALGVTLSINLHYYFAAVDSEQWSAGRFAELSSIGPSQKLRPRDQDLARALPREALLQAKDQVPHDPMRLQVFVVASPAHIVRALGLSPRALRAWRARWFSLISIDPTSGAAQVLRPSEASSEVGIEWH